MPVLSNSQAAYTGQTIARTRPKTYRKVVALLAAGSSHLSISKECRVSEHSVIAISRAEAETITERKQSLAALAARIARGAGESIEDVLAKGTIPVNSLPVVFGVAVDKLVALSDQPATTIRVDIHSVPDIYSEFRAAQDAIKMALAHEVHPVHVLTDVAPATPDSELPLP